MRGETSIFVCSYRCVVGPAGVWGPDHFKRNSVDKAANNVQKDGHIDLHEQLQNINPGQFSSVHIFQKRSIIIQTGTIIKQSQPQDPWYGPLTPVLVVKNLGTAKP